MTTRRKSWISALRCRWNAARRAASPARRCGGRPYYIAPEKLTHEPEDFRSDIYSLGASLFHAIAGRPCFEGETTSLTALRQLKSKPVSLEAVAPGVSSATAYVINRSLCVDPKDRHQSYEELIEHLSYARTKLLERGIKVAPFKGSGHCGRHLHSAKKEKPAHPCRHRRAW